MGDKNYTHGRFVWRELMTTNVDDARSFYGELFAWTFKGSELPHGGTYWLTYVGTKQIAGMMQKPKDVDAPPHWSGYVSVPDVDAATARAKAEGGQSPMSMDLDDVGRMGLIIDPGGAVSWAFKSVHGDTPMTGRPEVGEFCWESLASTDLAKAKSFYQAVYGWKPSDFNGMTVFGVGEGMENQVADLMPAPPGAPSFWGSHVVVAKVADARARVTKLGGKIVMEEIAVPNIGLISVVQDRQGATISLFEPQM
jgi:hypothetical protein